MDKKISDSYPINVKPITWREKYIIDEAKAWLDENIGDEADRDLVKRLVANTEELVRLAKAKARSDAIHL